MSDKDKVISFEDLKKQSEENKKAEENKKIEDNKVEPVNPNIPEANEFLSMFEEMGMDLDEGMGKQLMEILNNKEVMDLIQNLDINPFDPSSVNKLAHEMKEMENKIKREQKSFRAFSQWQNFYRPFSYENLYPIEILKLIADKIGISYSNFDSKNEIISKLKPQIGNYLTSEFKMITRDYAGIIGNVIYHEGELEQVGMKPESYEMMVDILVSKGLVARVKSNGLHLLVVPSEILSALPEVNFAKLDKYNELNQLLIHTLIGFVNSYGIITYELALTWLKELYSDKIEKLFEYDDFTEHLKKLIEHNFSKSLIQKGMYSSVVFDNIHIHHGVVGFTQALIDISDESIKEYKEFDKEELLQRGKANFYENSLSLNKIMEILMELNEIDLDTQEELKNYIYIFSKLEFEPSLILNMLSVGYELPQAHKYEMFVEIIREYYKNSEKWILKGHSSFEINKSVSTKYDASKIVNIDFNKKS